MAPVHLVPDADTSKLEDLEAGIPPSGSHRVEETPHNFIRIWFNQGATHCVIYLKPGAVSTLGSEPLSSVIPPHTKTAARRPDGCSLS